MCNVGYKLTMDAKRCLGKDIHLFLVVPVLFVARRHVSVIRMYFALV